MLFSPQEAMQINILLSLVISLALIWQIRSDIDVGLLKKDTFRQYRRSAFW